MSHAAGDWGIDMRTVGRLVVAAVVLGAFPAGAFEQAQRTITGTAGGRAPAGWYLVRMSADGRQWVRRVALAR